MDRKTETTEVDLLGLFLYLKKRLWIILIALVLFTFGGYVKSAFLTTPLYTASTRMYVLNRTYDDRVVYTDFTASNYILYDYKELISGRNVTKEVVEKLGITDLSPSKLSDMITVTSPENTRILEIAIRDSDPLRAANLANAVREEAAVQIEEIMDADSVKLVYEAEIPKTPSSPNVAQDTFLAAVLGVVITVAVLAVIYLMDDTIRTEEDVEKRLGISVLGVIPMTPDATGSNSRPAPAARSPRTSAANTGKE